MSELTSLPDSQAQTSHSDEARLYDQRQGISLSTGAYISSLDNLSDSGAGRRMQDLVTGLAKALVDHPETVSVELIPEPTSTVLRLRVAASDIGKVIGKQGRTARSIRTILSAASMKMQHRFSLDIVEEGVASSAPDDKETASFD